MKIKTLQHQAKDDEIVIITVQYGQFYELSVFTKKEDALNDLWNCHKTNTCVIFCSDEEIEKKHLLQCQTT